MNIKRLEALLNIGRISSDRYLRPIVLQESSQKIGCIECISHGSNSAGYTRVRVNNSQTYLHRFVYFLVNLELDINEHLFVRHTCDNPFCCNPDHLIHGTNLENRIDYMLRGPSKILKEARTSKRIATDSRYTFSIPKRSRRSIHV